MDNYLSLIRNFCIIAHIDHGKSTVADRMLQITNAIDARDFRDQVLDSMDLERERGITIKCHPVTMYFQSADGQRYQFNLLDTPGHVDFTYEVSRSMAACEGAILLVDAAQGVEAQTLANAFLAFAHNLKIIPVLNKIDLSTANVADVSRQIEELLGISIAEGCLVSAKTGEGVREMMELVISRVPAPKMSFGSVSTRALIFDSVYGVFRGVVPYVRVFEGEINAGDRILLMRTGCESEVKEVGIFTPEMTPVKVLRAGQVGYIVGNIKSPHDIKIGDTVTTSVHASQIPLPGFKNIQPMVFSGVYPVNPSDYEKLKSSLDRLALNDSSFTYQNESSVALGFGFRCGFLGLLHLEIVQERLRREYNMDVISTYPAVVYNVYLKDGTCLKIDNPGHLPELLRIERIEEPMIKAFIICRNEQISDLMKLIMDRRGSLDKIDSLDTKRVMLTCTLPLNEILVDFYDCLKSLSHGYASMDYELSGYAAGEVVRLDILLNGEQVDAFSCLVHRSKAETKGRQMCAALKEVIPPHLFAIPLQAAIGRTIIARETIRALRKDVTAKCYGGDITRKRKLLERQKEGKRRMRQVGKVNVPQEAFIRILRSGT